MGEALHQRGLTVLGVRLAGHATRPEDLIHTRWQDWMVSVEDGINLLRDSCEHIFYAGLSLGGALALTTAARIQPSGVIAMSALFSLPQDWRLNFARPLSVIVPMIGKDPTPDMDSDEAHRHVDYSAYPTRSFAEVQDLTKVMHAQLQAVKAPVLLVNSKDDPTVPLSQAESFKDLLTNSQVEQLILEKSGHVITEGEERKQVFEAAYKFIQKYSK
jgi:carboxylesterase